MINEGESETKRKIESVMVSLHFHYPFTPPLYPNASKAVRTLRRRTASNCTKQDNATPNSCHFVLVHGMCHGGWFWYKLARLLNEAGHRVTAPDLAACRLSPKWLEEVDTFEEYCEPLMEVMEAVPAGDRVVLVGHSYGGIPASLAMERFPEKIAVVVFVSAAMPTCTNPLASVLEEDVTLATMLLRPGKLFYDSSVTRNDFVTEEKHGSVNRLYVVCSQDRSISREFQIWSAEMSPGTEVAELNAQITCRCFPCRESFSVSWTVSQIGTSEKMFPNL